MRPEFLVPDASARPQRHAWPFQGGFVPGSSRDRPAWMTRLRRSTEPPVAAAAATEEGYSRQHSGESMSDVDTPTAASEGAAPCEDDALVLRRAVCGSYGGGFFEGPVPVDGAEAKEGSVSSSAMFVIRKNGTWWHSSTRCEALRSKDFPIGLRCGEMQDGIAETNGSWQATAPPGNRAASTGCTFLRFDVGAWRTSTAAGMEGQPEDDRPAEQDAASGSEAGFCGVVASPSNKERPRLLRLLPPEPGEGNASVDLHERLLSFGFCAKYEDLAFTS
eukprot:TRINITY_DN58704_c0_g1_i1.p1 TRINITY_DN58704_c0_g1~~TRINITY_DN58704_c0_g1_i1.p1  ORF type:complete len:276 (-),score=60.66 TRINITY_DN58704_c0_g1_i1:329-1156(-)